MSYKIDRLYASIEGKKIRSAYWTQNLKWFIPQRKDGHRMYGIMDNGDERWWYISEENHGQKWVIVDDCLPHSMDADATDGQEDKP